MFSPPGNLFEPDRGSHLFSFSFQKVPEKTVRSIRYLDKEIVNLKKDLVRSRFLMQCVKIGRGYFNILQEENAMKKKQQQLQKLREEELNKFQPAKKYSDIQCRDNMMTDPLYRQLCALHWLLEALTIDHTHHVMRPLIACWNPKDPGGSKSTIKKINKDKSMGQRWDHFVTAPKLTLEANLLSVLLPT
ncbi:coiled-coil domain-containing protein 60 [Cricetulus griseus]|uniref:Coiled-coil domain-containing protein 60 n=1 Tax=Cricetulus griseus TaxID=10029 RepID=A0A061I417_CRIGR|nr:coiled-coil domain-containing protein 60 [Cricetulus griseus]